MKGLNAITLLKNRQADWEPERYDEWLYEVGNVKKAVVRFHVPLPITIEEYKKRAGLAYDELQKKITSL